MSKKLTAIIASAAIVAGGIGLTAALTTQGLSSTGNVASTTTTSTNKTLVDETIYVFAKTDGSVRKIISSDWSKNLDLDEYTKIETPNKKTPIDLKITYTLDGKEISASDLAGKSGKVTIRYEYTNKERSGSYYIPYAVVSGLVMDNSHFTNVTAKNGKVINDGSRTIVAGIAMPGMQENLGLSKDTLEIPDYLEATADATNFELSMSVSVATNEIFKDLDVSGLSSIDELSSELGKLTSAMDQLIGGSSDLYNGISELYEQAGKLPAGITALAEGSSQLATGATKLDSGIDTLNSGVAELQTSVNTKLAAGANQIVGANYANSTALSDGVAALVEQTITTTLNTYNPNFSGLLPLFANFGLPSTELTHANYSTNLTAWAKAMDNAQIAAALTNYGQDATTLKTQFDTLNASLAKLDTLAEKTAAYTAGVNQLAAGINGDLLSGIAKLQAGTTELKAGSAALASGASDLNDGLAALNTSAPALVDGIEKLQDGSLQLSNGIKQFNEEGIKKLVSVYNNDIKGLVNRIETIAGLAKNNASSVKYIYRVDEIK